MVDEEPAVDRMQVCSLHCEAGIHDFCPAGNEMMVCVCACHGDGDDGR